MAKYRKVDPRIWNDRKFYSSSLSCQHLFFFILTHPQMTPVGAMRCSPFGLSDELEWEAKGFPEAFAEAFAEGCEKGFWKHDGKAKILVVPKFLKYNPPESANVVKAWGKCWDDLPECDLKTELFQRLKGLVEGYGEGYQQALRQAFPKDYAESGAGAGAGTEHMSGSGAPDLHESKFDEARKMYPLAKNDNRQTALKAWKARIRAGVDPDEILEGVKRYARYVEGEEIAPRYRKHMATFLGPDEHWKLEWKVLGKVPDDPAELSRVADENNVTLPDNCRMGQARKLVAEATGMSL